MLLHEIPSAVVKLPPAINIPWCTRRSSTSPSMPAPSIVHGDFIGGREQATGNELSLVYGQRFDLAVHALTQGIPFHAVPTGDVSDRDATRFTQSSAYHQLVVVGQGGTSKVDNT